MLIIKANYILFLLICIHLKKYLKLATLKEYRKLLKEKE